ncbi:B3 domain-containing transcription factor ABI3 [Rutidosis leptorrhynchoides]|uniref:B3 domain-containing transcription factor ABI3 n=1 Tax=Rutidosis leptorrhynchoides TaxID=125765 RepID=UPI003A98F1A9
MDQQQGVENGGWGHQEEDDLIVDDASMFYSEFPTLPDFPCMSSSSSSSSTPAPVKSSMAATSSSSSSSSSAASWAILRSDADEDTDKTRHHRHHHDHNDDNQHAGATSSQNDQVGALSSTASMEILPGEYQPSDQHQEDNNQGGGGRDFTDHFDCMDHVMENLGYMDLLDANDFFDPSSIFQTDDEGGGPEDNFRLPNPSDDVFNNVQGVGGNGSESEDLAMLFLRWLRSNKETVSAEDLRKVKLKKATVDCAVRRLGGGQTGMKELLKLVLEWVQTNHLPKPKPNQGETSTSNQASTNYTNQYSNQDIFHQNPNVAVSVPPHPSFVPSPWINPPTVPYASTDPVAVAYPIAAGYTNMGQEPLVTNLAPAYPQPVIESARTWPPQQFAMYGSFPDNNFQQQVPIQAPAFGNVNRYPYPCFQEPSSDNKLARSGSSAAKEARKKRMARQRKFISYHRHHHHHNHSHRQIGGDQNQPNPNNWVYWPNSPTNGTVTSASQPMMSSEGPAVHHLADQPAPQSNPRQQAADKRQGLKPEKNLKFLLQKVLKQSDVGNLGRIVLPKKEAETHLPGLEARDGITIAMEDIGTSRVWNMRYRFWPNNKSRMYLLENTGDFVRSNGLQEGDFIVIYSDIKCGKYLIRGVKVRQQGQKPETKRGGKSQKQK